MKDNQIYILLKKNIVVMIFILLLTENLSARDYTKLYHEFIPKQYTNNDNQCMQIQDLLTRKSLIHPSLIYYYLQYYQSLGRKDSFCISQSILAHAKKMEDLYNNKREQWATRQIQLLDNLKLDGNMNALVKRNFERWEERPSPETSSDSSVHSDDKNLCDYMILHSYTQETSEQYQPEVNYEQKRVSMEHDKREQLLFYFNNPQSNHLLNAEDMIDTVLLQWYLFDSTETHLSIKQPCELFYDVISSKYSKSTYSRLFFGIGYTINSITMDESFILCVPGYNNNDVNIPVNSSFSQNGIFACLSYRGFLKNYLSAFSYLEADLFLSFNKQKNDKPLDTQSSYYENPYLITQTVTFQKSTIELESFQSYYCNVNTPVFVFSNDFSLNLGFEAGCNIVNYKFDYDYTYTGTRLENPGFWYSGYYFDTVGCSTAKGMVKKTDYLWTFFPTVNLHYDLCKEIVIQAVLSNKYYFVHINYALL